MRRARIATVLALLAATALVPGAAPRAGAEDGPRPQLFVTLDRDSAVPGQAIALEITLLVPTWMPEPPVFPSFELPNLMIRMPEEASGPTQRPVGGETWPGIIRTYLLHPMATGEYRLPAGTIAVTWADPPNPPRTITLPMEEIVFSGRAPAGAEDLDPFLAAESLTLEQFVDGEPGALEPGDAVTRVVTATLTGSSPLFLPPLLTPTEVPGLAAYPAEPEIRESADGIAFEGTRVERVTWVAEAGARANAAPVRVRWWNLREARIETTELPGFEIVSTGPSPAVAGSQGEARPFPWIAVSLGAVAASIGGALLLRVRSRIAEAFARRRARWRASEASPFFASRAALRRHALGDALREIDVWRSRLEGLGEGDFDALDHALGELGASLYGPRARTLNDADWMQAERTLRETRRHVLLRRRARRRSASLPALNPRVR